MSLRRLPPNVWVLAASQALSMSCAPFLILVGGLVGTQLAPKPTLATLPIALMIVGSAVATFPAVLLMKRFGRKGGSYIGYGVQLAGIGSMLVATYHGSWAFFLVGGSLIGASLAFAQQYRFAALESLSDKKDFGTALAVMMSGGLLSAYLGPELAALGANWIDSETGYVGSFLLLAILSCVGILVFSFFQTPVVKEELSNEPARPLRRIVGNPFFVVSIISTAVGFSVMSLVMTATPVNMSEICGYTLTQSKSVLQSHLVAMFLPSFLSPVLMKRFGLSTVMLVGALIYGGMAIIALSGQSYVHFWWALLLLGVGWNFLFVSGTALLPRSYRPSERFKVQAINDSVVFGMQASGSLSAGWLLFRFGWSTIVWICLPLVAVAIAGSVYLMIKRVG